jgi:flagellar motor switch protein FliM
MTGDQAPEMTDSAARQAMRRKAGSERPAPAQPRMTVGRAWKVAVPRAADTALGIRATAVAFEEQRLRRDEVATSIAPNALIALLEGPDGRFGIAVLDAGLLSAVLEASTTGRLTDRPVAERTPTRTDAMMAADLVDGLCEEFEVALAEMEDPPSLAGYRYAAPLLDAATLAMVLPETGYSVFRLGFDLGGGVRRGGLIVALPNAPAAAGRGEEVEAFRQRLSDTVMAAHADLDAVLWRLRMSLADVARLEPGAVLRVPLEALGSVEVATAGAAKLAVARLGQQGGRRAVRLADVAVADDHDDDATAFVAAAPSPAPAALPSEGQ